MDAKPTRELDAARRKIVLSGSSVCGGGKCPRADHCHDLVACRHIDRPRSDRHASGEQGELAYAKLCVLSPEDAAILGDLLWPASIDLLASGLVGRERADGLPVYRAGAPGLQFNGHERVDGETVRQHACKLGFEGVVSKTIERALCTRK